jgi:hypothetical protein
VEIFELTNAEISISSRDAGKQIDFNDEQLPYFVIVIRRRLLFRSKFRFSIKLSEKQFIDSSSTEDGMQIDFSDRQPLNALASIRRK